MELQRRVFNRTFERMLLTVVQIFDSTDKLLQYIIDECCCDLYEECIKKDCYMCRHYCDCDSQKCLHIVNTIKANSKNNFIYRNFKKYV